MATRVHTERKVIYLAQVAAGAHASFADGPGCSGGQLSTYDSLEQLLARAGQPGDRGLDIAEGAWIVDGREVADDDAYRVAVYGPMLDTADTDLDRVWDGLQFDLPSDPVGSLVLSTVGVAYVGAGVIAGQMVASERPGPLTKVPPKTQAACWAEVGAKVGRWRAGGVDWVSPFADPNQLAMEV